MLLIEMHANNIGSDSYIWMIGKPWPVPLDEEEYVMRVEVFGPELLEMAARPVLAALLETARVTWGAYVFDTGSGVTPEVASWRMLDAQAVSRAMRKVYAAPRTK
jgi:hypothetical protein